MAMDLEIRNALFIPCIVNAREDGQWCYNYIVTSIGSTHSAVFSIKAAKLKCQTLQ